MALKKHVDVDHVVIAKTIEEEIKNPMKMGIKMTTSKKKLNISSNAILLFFDAKDPFKKHSYKTTSFWLSKNTYLFNLWKIRD
jgi:hypothetical protein